MTTVSNKIKALLLLADSRLLFNKDVLERFLNETQTTDLKAAYIGVNNDDDPVFYDLFAAAMDQIGIEEHMHISADFSERQQKFLAGADLILLSGGDTFRGWQILQRTGISENVVKRYYQGSYLIGISAGAIQMGLYGLNEQNEPFQTMSLIPLIIDVHDEKNDWAKLQEIHHYVDKNYLTAIGIPAGGGLLYHPGHELEAIEQPLTEFRLADGNLSRQLIMPQTRFTIKQEQTQ